MRLETMGMPTRCFLEALAWHMTCEEALAVHALHVPQVLLCYPTTPSKPTCGMWGFLTEDLHSFLGLCCLEEAYSTERNDDEAQRCHLDRSMVLGVVPTK